MEYDLLTSGGAICLANCFVTREEVEYGFGFYAQNTPPVIALYDENKKFVTKIKTPDEAIDKNIQIAFGDRDGRNAAKRVF
jgi:hypothetical protein